MTVVIFLMGSSRIRLFLIRIKFHWGGKKEGVKGGYGGESLKEGYFCKIPIIKQETNFISQTFGQANF